MCLEIASGNSGKAIHIQPKFFFSSEPLISTGKYTIFTKLITERNKTEVFQKLEYAQI